MKHHHYFKWMALLLCAAYLLKESRTTFAIVTRQPSRC